MSDIFISYAREDRAKAQSLAAVFQKQGWSVWWDRSIPPGRSFDEVIEQALAAARCVVVIWSKASASSDWVKTEAAEGLSRKILVPVGTEEINLPLEFRRLQTVDLTSWNGDATDPSLHEFLTARRRSHPERSPAATAAGSSSYAPNASLCRTDHCPAAGARVVCFEVCEHKRPPDSAADPGQPNRAGRICTAGHE
jgi:hypothetical protein